MGPYDTRVPQNSWGLSSMAILSLSAPAQDDRSPRVGSSSEAPLSQHEMKGGAVSSKDALSPNKSFSKQNQLLGKSPAVGATGLPRDHQGSISQHGGGQSVRPSQNARSLSISAGQPLAISASTTVEDKVPRRRKAATSPRKRPLTTSGLPRNAALEKDLLELAKSTLAGLKGKGWVSMEKDTKQLCILGEGSKPGLGTPRFIRSSRPATRDGPGAEASNFSLGPRNTKESSIASPKGENRSPDHDSDHAKAARARALIELGQVKPISRLAGAQKDYDRLEVQGASPTTRSWDPNFIMRIRSLEMSRSSLPEKLPQRAVSSPQARQQWAHSSKSPSRTSSGSWSDGSQGDVEPRRWSKDHDALWSVDFQAMSDTSVDSSAQEFSQAVFDPVLAKRRQQSSVNSLLPRDNLETLPRRYGLRAESDELGISPW